MSNSKIENTDKPTGAASSLAEPHGSAFPDMPNKPGWYWVRTRAVPDAPWFVLEVHHNDNGVPVWREDGDEWPVEPNADFVGPLIPPNTSVTHGGTPLGPRTVSDSFSE